MYIYVCVVVMSAMLLTINVVLGGCWCPWVLLDSEKIESYMHHFNHCVHVIPVLGSKLLSGGMVGVTQYHCYTKLHYVS
jgi:hypothetical protein